jgi:hypothetical protein
MDSEEGELYVSLYQRKITLRNLADQINEENDPKEVNESMIRDLINDKQKGTNTFTYGCIKAGNDSPELTLKIIFDIEDSEETLHVNKKDSIWTLEYVDFQETKYVNTYDGDSFLNLVKGLTIITLNIIPSY